MHPEPGWYNQPPVVRSEWVGDVTSKILELYARHGRSLADLGLHEAALPVNQTDVALSLFCQQGWRVLGGDVYRLASDGRLESSYENWFYGGTSAEESVVVARNFIHSLVSTSAYVVLVVRDCQ